MQQRGRTVLDTIQLRLCLRMAMYITITIRGRAKIYARCELFATGIGTRYDLPALVHIHAHLTLLDVRYIPWPAQSCNSPTEEDWVRPKHDHFENQGPPCLHSRMSCLRALLHFQQSAPGSKLSKLSNIRTQANSVGSIG